MGDSSNHEELLGKTFSFVRNGKQTIWILDSGDTNHIVCSLKFLTSSKRVENHTVELPNGSYATVTYVGQVVFSPNLILDIVYVCHCLS